MRAALALSLCLWCMAAGAADPGSNAMPAHAFFAFDNGVGRGKWPPAQQAKVLKELGYVGISYNETIQDLHQRRRSWHDERRNDQDRKSVV